MRDFRALKRLVVPQRRLRSQVVRQLLAKLNSWRASLLLGHQVRANLMQPPHVWLYAPDSRYLPLMVAQNSPPAFD